MLSSNDSGKSPATPFIRAGHIGDLIVPDDDQRRPYVVLHPNFRSQRGEPKTSEEHTVKQALARVLTGSFSDDEFTRRRFGYAHQFHTNEAKEAAA
ncbi:hypothetical protein SAMN04244553_3616 [Nocardia amikacinitolerans]|uniref:Uncharacterized protein n=1 Tax=Nocardia amikacinitolerans TaxID=756689 RepID=A0A285LH75_9NOCA|nr:hypothetical protein [Nocardia amikacinitolerans]SNY84309.1 hypothetical protein SAMN04244553_3616 [Nocardia amikacinitolerans]